MLLCNVIRRSCCHPSLARYAHNSIEKVSIVRLASPLLLRLHPDTCQRYAKPYAKANENALKQLNFFIEMANFGCNREIMQVQSILRSNDAVKHGLSMEFYIKTGEKPRFARCKYVIRIPKSLQRRTNAFGNFDLDAIAEEWRRMTRKVFRELFAMANIVDSDDCLSVLGTETEKMSKLSAKKERPSDSFETEFERYLRSERELIVPLGCGQDDVPLETHQVLHSLLSERVRIEKCQHSMHPKEEHYRAFSWLANVLLIHFDALKMYWLVWNKVSLIVAWPRESAELQVAWDPNRPKDGMVLIVPFGMETDALVKDLNNKIETLEEALTSEGKVKSIRQYKIG